jgi:hypothetical protein
MTMARKPLPPGLHLVSGDFTAALFERVFSDAGTKLIVDTDVLSHGPTPRRDRIEDWQVMRARFWNELEGDTGAPPHINPILNELPRFSSAPAITVWAATGLDDLLFIASCIHLAEIAGVDASRLRLVQFETLPLDRTRLLGLGFLDEAALAKHADPRPFTAHDLEDYRGLWSALTSRDPQAFENFPKLFPEAHPWLHQAARLMLRRFPDANTGLPHWDRLLLEVARRRAPNLSRTIADTMTKDWSDPDLVGDWVLFARLRRLADKHLPRPLLKLDNTAQGLRDATIELTPFGAKVLEGRAKFYPTNPIDDWVGGVHLVSDQGRLWVQDRGRVRQTTSGDIGTAEWSLSG